MYTDGACKGNPGAGGFCCILRYKGKEKLVSGGEANTTNNRMELCAVIRGLEILRLKICRGRDEARLGARMEGKGLEKERR